MHREGLLKSRGKRNEARGAPPHVSRLETPRAKRRSVTLRVSSVALSPPSPPRISLLLSSLLFLFFHPKPFLTSSLTAQPKIMTLVSRSAIRLSRRGGQQLKNARANAALFKTAANQAKNIVPKFAASSSRVTLPAKAGEYFATLFSAGWRWFALSTRSTCHGDTTSGFLGRRGAMLVMELFN